GIERRRRLTRWVAFARPVRLARSAHQARRGHAIVEPAAQVRVAARTKDAAGAAEVRLRAQLPVAVVHDHAGSAVVEAGAVEVREVAIEREDAAAKPRPVVEIDGAAAIGLRRDTRGD